MSKQDNPWRSVDANGYDYNSGEEFDPAPRTASTAAQAPQSAASATTQAAPRAAAPTATQVPRSQAVATAQAPQADELRRAVEQSRQTRLEHADTSTMRGYLEQARDAAAQEAAGRIDRGVTRGANELRRVQEDAEEQYRTQRNQIDLDERRAYDNRAAYDAARGVRGGIAGEQYSSIANTAAQNRATLNNARTKLGTDLRREMAELRANGEWEKARSLLQATQAYLSQLVQLEQWAQEYNVGVDQFNAQLEQNYLGYLLQLRQMEISTDQWEREFAANRADTAWNQRFQQGQADIARQQWERSFAADRADTAWNQQFQQGQADVARQQWERSFEADRADTAWNQQFQQGQADVARQQWERSFEADRADTAWNQQFQQQQADTARQQWQLGFEADRTDTRWNQLFQQGQAAFQRRQYADTRADTARQTALSYAESMMNVGMMPDDNTLQAAGISKEYAQLYISAVEAARSIAGGQSGNLSALAEAYVASGSETPKTWLAENYKSYGFGAKPDFDEFQDAVDVARENTEAESTGDSGEAQHFNPLHEQWIRGMIETESLTAEQKAAAVNARINFLWPKLSRNQKNELRRILSEYGLSYLSDEELLELQLQQSTGSGG